MDDTRKVFGIDLGTTYSCVAQVNEFDQAMVLNNFEGDTTTPSVVYFEQDNKVIVGKEAKNMLAKEPERTVAFIKRDISSDKAYEEQGKYPAGYDPTEISARILQKVVQDANSARQDPEPVNKVVITCPAYFGTKERLRTRQAGEIAGLEVLAVINEPTAAAIAYGMKVEDEKTIMVYDLGGGTFDVTIIRVNNGTIIEVATGGNQTLGGYDWDRELASYLLSAFNREHGTQYTLDSDAKLTNQLMLTAEDKKKSLSGRDSVNAIIDYNGKSSRIAVTREAFEQMTLTKLDETIEKVHEVIEKAKNKNVTNIDEVLLVGGSSRMLQVKARVDSEFNCDAKLHDPDQCVAKGAAIYALKEAYAQAIKEYGAGDRDEKPEEILKGAGGRVIRVTSKNYGTDVLVGGKKMVDQLIFADSPLDGHCRAERTYLTSEDNQSGISMCVYESNVPDEKIEPIAATLLGDRSLPLTKKWPKGTPVKVVFEVDPEGVLHVHASIGPDSLDYILSLKGVKTVEEMQEAISRAKSTTVE